MTRKLNVPAGESLLLELATSRKPLGMASTPPAYHVLRETYFDTTDGSLERHRMTLCLRSEAQGRQLVELSVIESMNLAGIAEETAVETPVVDGGLYATLAGSSEVATRVRAVVDPHALRPRLALDLDRETRELKSGLFGRASHRLVLDEVVAHAPGSTRAFQELTLVELAPARTSLETLAARLRDRHGAENDGLGTYERIRTLLREGGAAAARASDVTHDVRVALMTIRGWDVALVDSASGLTLPSARGSGEEAARTLLASIGDEDADDTTELDLVGFTTPRAGGSDLEVWLHESPRSGDGRAAGFVWLPLLELLERIGGPRLRDPGLIAALLMVIRSEIGLRLLREAPQSRGAPRELPPARPAVTRVGEADDFLDLDLSILDFNQRVLEMAEDPTVPLLERFRFLSIFSSNMDEFFVVRVARLKDEVARGASEAYEDLSPPQLLDLASIRVRALLARQYGCLKQVLLPELAERGVRIRRWSELEQGQRSALAGRFSQEIFPVLTPLKLSSSSVRSFPRLVSLGLALAAVLRRPGEGRTELGYVAIPKDLPRLLPVPGTRDVIAIEDVIGANASELFSAEVQDVHAFRASRTADVEVDEDSSGSLLAAIADEVSERPYKPVMRLEVDATMPREVRAYLLKEIRAEQGADASMLTRADVYEIDGLLDLRCRRGALRRRDRGRPARAVRGERPSRGRAVGLPGLAGRRRAGAPPLPRLREDRGPLPGRGGVRPGRGGDQAHPLSDRAAVTRDGGSAAGARVGQGRVGLRRA